MLVALATYLMSDDLRIVASQPTAAATFGRSGAPVNPCRASIVLFSSDTTKRPKFRLDLLSPRSPSRLQHLVSPQVLNDRSNVGQETYREQRDAQKEKQAHGDRRRLNDARNRKKESEANGD